ncbi:hypothetical protein A4G19_09110 [Pasteurellaceae bacterium Macca]|nr:hypothetical protein [Pasteurellaceae bacterium Macca]
MRSVFYLLLFFFLIFFYFLAMYSLKEKVYYGNVNLSIREIEYIFKYSFFTCFAIVLLALLFGRKNIRNQTVD